jgi:glucose-6-phosphate 1-dehydrogenase
MQDTCTALIIGAIINLDACKPLPARYRLEARGRLSPWSQILGFGRRPWTDEIWRTEVEANRLFDREDQDWRNGIEEGPNQTL